MLLNNEELFENARIYAKRRHLRILSQPSLGDGTDGHVWKTSNHSAIKALYRRENYENELRCYQRLKSLGVHELCGLNVPVLEGHDDRLRVIEMTFVQAPYLLDFGKASLDSPPSYLVDEKDLQRFQAEGRAEFRDRWPEVNAVLYTLQAKCGIFYIDPKTGNIKLDAEEDDSDDWMKEPEIDYSEYD